MPAQIITAADAIQRDVEKHITESGITYKQMPLDEKLATYLTLAAEQMAVNLRSTFSALKPWITDFINFGPSIYERHHTMDTAKKATMLGLSNIELHSLDLGGASAPAGLELARKLCESDERVVLIAGAEVPRGGGNSIAYYREVNDALLEPKTELHTHANLIALYALLADRLMFDAGLTTADVETITSHYRDLAQNNTRAAMHNKPLKPGELRRYLAGPYATAMVAVATDHAAAILVVNDRAWTKLSAALKISTPAHTLFIHAVGTNYGEKYLTRRMDFSSPAQLAGKRAFAQAAFTPQQIDYAWIYDCFTLMLVRQAADYFNLTPRDAAKTLSEGFISVEGKQILVNKKGGILNTQAAISLSAASGLLDILDYAENNHEAKYFLFGGNGGIDCINSVALLSRESLAQKNSNWPAGSATQPPAQKLVEEEIALLYAAANIHFNPGAKVPFALGVFRRNDGSLILAQMIDSEFNNIDNVAIFVRDKARCKILQTATLPVAVMLTT